MKKFLLWDFDGVLFNSLDECLISSYNAYQSFVYNKTTLISKLDQIPENHQQFYYKYRKHVRPAGEYFIIHYAFERNIELDNYSTFTTLLSDNSKLIPEFQSLVFKKREKLKLQNLQQWISLHKPYNGIPKIWCSLNEHFNHYIVSNKDQASILSLMDGFQLNIDKKNVFGGDFSSNKHEIISHLIKTFNIPPEKAYFIDDNYHHLNDVSDTGINLIYADWGYGDSPKDDVNLATVLNPSNLPEMILKRL